MPRCSGPRRPTSITATSSAVSPSPSKTFRSHNRHEPISVVPRSSCDEQTPYTANLPACRISKRVSLASCAHSVAPEDSVETSTYPALRLSRGRDLDGAKLTPTTHQYHSRLFVGWGGGMALGIYNAHYASKVKQDPFQVWVLLSLRSEVDPTSSKQLIGTG